MEPGYRLRQGKSGLQKNCYAERMAHRLHLMGSARYVNEFAPALNHDLIDKAESHSANGGGLTRRDPPSKFPIAKVKHRRGFRANNAW